MPRKEESLIEEMRAALAHDREALGRPAPPLPAPSPPDDAPSEAKPPTRGLLARLFGRGS